MHMGVRCFKIEQQEDDKQVNIGPNNKLFKRLKA